MPLDVFGHVCLKQYISCLLYNQLCGAISFGHLFGYNVLLFYGEAIQFRLTGVIVTLLFRKEKYYGREVGGLTRIFGISLIQHFMRE